MHITGIEQNQSQTETPKRFQCRHIFTDGHRCGSPCLRGEDLCYYHHTTRKPAAHPRARRTRCSTFEIPLPEDRSAIQHTIGQVLQRIAANDIDPRRAGLLLYGLQIASLNLPKEPAATKPARQIANQTVEEITTHPELGLLAPPAEVGHAVQRKSAVALLLEKMMQEDDADEKQSAINKTADKTAAQAAILPAVQATASDSAILRSCRHPDPELVEGEGSRRTLRRHERPSLSASKHGIQMGLPQIHIDQTEFHIYRSHRRVFRGAGAPRHAATPGSHSKNPAPPERNFSHEASTHSLRCRSHSSYGDRL